MHDARRSLAFQIFNRLSSRVLVCRERARCPGHSKERKNRGGQPRRPAEKLEGLLTADKRDKSWSVHDEELGKRDDSRGGATPGPFGKNRPEAGRLHCNLELNTREVPPIRGETAKEAERPFGGRYYFEKSREKH